MKTTISIPDPLFEAAQGLARRLGMSRSQFFSTAVDDLVQKYRSSGVTGRLNAVYEINSEARSLEPEFEELQSRSLVGDGW
jgi:metal-responsive CopG/Arc/MetJ family transcriptional regulator